MTETVLNVANRALQALGARSEITDLNDGTNESKAINKRFTTCVDEVLGASWWNFARFTKSLTLFKSVPDAGYSTWDGTTMPTPPWNYSYLFPDDCINPRYVVSVPSGPGAGVPIFTNMGFTNPTLMNGAPIRFISGIDISSGSQIRVLMTNEQNAALCYTARVSNPDLWDRQFMVAFEYTLASYLAIDITGDRGRASDLAKIANAKIVEARVSDANEGLTIQEHNPDWLAIRGNGITLGAVGPIGANS